MIVVARYLKGCKMLERYEVKVSRTVLRRGGASNRFLLSLRFNLPYHNRILRKSEKVHATRIIREPKSDHGDALLKELFSL